MLDNTTVVIPSHNTLNHLKNTYDSVRRYYPTLPLIIIDDASNDGTDVWLRSLVDAHLTTIIDPVRKGHTFWYDEGMRIASTDIVAILHSDMMIGPMYFDNLLKHLTPGTVVCGTRVEPPIHPEGMEKIVKNFGMDYNDFNYIEFEKFCLDSQIENRGVITRGIFAPWVLYKNDHLSIGGHDQNFAPYGYEDSDIFNRWILAGYRMVQSRDALVYHLTCRGHRWNKGIGIENADYKETMEKGQKYFLRKWGQWIQNDAYMFPIILPKFDIRLVVRNLRDIRFLSAFEPMFSVITTDNPQLVQEYIAMEQPKTTIDMASRVTTFTTTPDLTTHDINVILDLDRFTNTDAQTLHQLVAILTEMKDIPDVGGEYELGNITVHITKLEDTVTSLIHAQ